MATLTRRDATPLAAYLPALLLIALGGVGQYASAQAIPAESPGSCVPAWIPASGEDRKDSAILTVAPGPDDFVYLGGLQGLHRMEGGRMRSWYPDPAVDSALPGGSVAALAWQGAVLWVGTKNGLARFHPQSGAFDRVSFTPDDAGAPAVSSLYVRDEQLLIGTSRGGVRLDLADGSFSALEFAGPGEGTRVRQFLEFEGRLVAATSAGLQVATAEDTFELVALDPDATRQVAVPALARGTADVLWVGAADGLFRVTSLAPPVAERFTHDALAGIPGGAIEALTVDAHGTLWMGGWGGLSRWRPGADAPEVCRRFSAVESDIAVPVNHLATASGDVLIMGTSGGGVRVAPLRTAIRRILTGEPAYGDLPETIVFSTLVDAVGRLVLGTNSGLFRERQPGSGTFLSLTEGILEERRIQAIHEQEDDGTLWLGTNRGLYVLRDGEVAPKPMLLDADGAAGAEVVYAIKPYGRRLLVGTRQGLVVLDADTGLPERLFRGSSSDRPVNDAPTSVESLGRIWHVDVAGEDVFATGDEDVYRLDIDAGTVAASTLEARRQGRLSAGRRSSAAGTSTGDVFIASENGIIRTDRDFETITYLTSLNGFRLGSVSNTRRSADGVVWFGGPLGAFAIDPRSDTWRLISYEDGLHARAFVQGSLSVGREGTIVSASGEGVSVVPPALSKREKRRSLRLVALDARSSNIVSHGQRLVIGPRTRSLTIEFATPDLIEVDRLGIEYTLTSSRQTSSAQLDFGEELALQQLQPGNYRFQARIIDPTGDRSPALRFGLAVRPYWWETRVFFVLCLLGVSLLVGTAFYIRSKAVQRRFDLVGDERKRIAQELHDTFMQDVFGARMLGRSIAEAQTVPEVRSQVDQMLDLLASATASVRTSVEALSQLTDLPPLSDALRALNPPSQQQSPVPITVVEEGAPWRVRSQRRFFICRIAQEAVNNACKHARATEVLVRLRWSRFGLTLDIEDDGRGFDVQAAEAAGGFGLGAMQRMAHAGRVSLAIESTPGAGTRVRISAARYRL